MKRPKRTRAPLHQFWPSEPSDLWVLPPLPPRKEERPDAQRQKLINRAIWIHTPETRRVWGALEDFVKVPIPDSGWHGLLLIAHSLSGVTTLLRRFIGSRGQSPGPTMLHIDMPASVREAEFYDAITKVGQGYRYEGKSLSDKKADALKVCAMNGVRCLIIDQGENLAYVSAAKRFQMLATIKLWAQEARVPVILVAPPKLASRILSDDWGRRFETLILPKLRLDIDFLNVLQDWERWLPLQQPSNLAERELALHLYALCDGKLGLLANILRQAARAVIDHGSEHISIPALDSLGLEPPPTFRGFHV